MRKIFLLILCLLTFSGFRIYSKDYLKELDLIISERSKYENSKQKEIAKSWADYSAARTDSDRYNALRNLYKDYRTFRIDSAIIIADKRLEIARKWGMKSKIASASLNLAESYVKSGLADKALQILDTLDAASLEDYHQKYRNSVYRYVYTLKAKTEMLPSDRIRAMEKLKQLRDSALAESTPDSRSFHVIQAEKFIDAGMPMEAVAKIEEADRIFDFSDDAAMQYTMGEIYLRAGMKQEAKECLSRAAILDLSSGSKEYRALILLSSLLFDEGDVERAFVYINCAFEDIHFSNANFRNPEIMENMPVIDTAFHAYEKKNIRLTRTFLWIAGALVLLLGLMLGALFKVHRSNRRVMAANEEINARLQAHNDRLKDADLLKLRNINTLIMSNARYIDRLENYRKEVYRLVRTNQYEKALDALKSERNNSKDINTFHEMFDETFISMFPDFVSDVNKLLKEPVELKEPGRLTPELRVIALMRLGFTSTDDISRILQYSSQTVYNLRSSIRNMSKLPREEFEREIREL